jgi:5-methylcytosine-specific restriction endonuclease McrA
MRVFVLNADRQPLTPCHAAVARKLLATGRAAVLRRFPFTIILRRQVVDATPRPLRLKLDPGSKVTGVALVDDVAATVIFAAEVEHHGMLIEKCMKKRSAVRRNRRNRKTRYRKPRFDNRTRREGWLPPSLESRVANVETWVGRLCRFAPVGALSVETVRFDTQALQNPEVTGVEYQQGELAGYEVREYLLEKWGRRCAYCNAEHVPLQVEHVRPRDGGGTHRVSNLTLACGPCNQAKSNRPVEEFLARHPEVLKKILAGLKAPLKDAAAVNATRWVLWRRLTATGLPIEVGTGGRTKFNRTRLGLPKEHWLDAACVGASTPEQLQVRGIRPLSIKATGWGKRQMCGLNAHGFPTRHRTRKKLHFGFQTGDIVSATVTRKEVRMTHVGRVAVRASGSFKIGGSIEVTHRACKKVHRCDGYEYKFQREDK